MMWTRKGIRRIAVGWFQICLLMSDEHILQKFWLCMKGYCTIVELEENCNAQRRYNRETMRCLSIDNAMS